jgi:hypothetical protein
MQFGKGDGVDDPSRGRSQMRKYRWIGRSGTMSDKMSDSRRRRAVWPSSRATTCLTQKLEVN